MTGNYYFVPCISPLCNHLYISLTHPQPKWWITLHWKTLTSIWIKLIYACEKSLGLLEYKLNKVIFFSGKGYWYRLIFWLTCLYKLCSTETQNVEYLNLQTNPAVIKLCVMLYPRKDPSILAGGRYCSSASQVNAVRRQQCRSVNSGVWAARHVGSLSCSQ